MSQFGPLDEEKVIIKKPMMLLSGTNKKQPPPPSFLSDAQEFSLLAALLFACLYAGLAAYNLHDRQHGAPCQEPAWLIRCYVLTGADMVDASRALSRGLAWCSAPQAAAAALALALIARCRSRRALGVRAATFVALAATAATHWMYVRLLGLFRIGSPGDLFLAVETASITAAAALDLLGFMAFVLGVDE